MINIKSEDGFSVHLKMAGDIEHAKRIIKRFVSIDVKSCVTVIPTTFVYPYGSEMGFIVGFENYPRFPKMFHEMQEIAISMAKELMVELNESSALVCTQYKNHWLYDDAHR